MLSNYSSSLSRSVISPVLTLPSLSPSVVSLSESEPGDQLENVPVHHIWLVHCRERESERVKERESQREKESEREKENHSVTYHSCH